LASSLSYIIMILAKPVYSKTVLLTPQYTARRPSPMPRVSVVMSVYNGERFLPQAVDSILAQTFTDFEFIVVDDGSTDGTAEILRDYTDPRLHVVRQENIGLIGSLTRAIGIASAKYIARMDADDISLPKRLEWQLVWLESHPQTAVLGTQVSEIGDDELTIRRHYYPMDSTGIERALLRGATALCHGSVVFRRACFKRVGGYRQRFEHAEDYDLWLRLIERYDMGNLAEILYRKRLNLDGVSFQSYFRHQRNAARALQCARHRRAGLAESSTLSPDSPPTRRELGDYHWHLGIAYADLGDLDKARTQLRSAISYAPTDPHIWLAYLTTLLGKPLTTAAFRFARNLVRRCPSLQKDPLGPFAR